MRLKNSVKSIRKKLKGINNWSIAEFITTLVLIGALGVVLYDVYQRRQEVPYITTLKIVDPVKVDAGNYRINDVITGFFEGERFVNKPAIFNRTLVCDGFNALLDPVRVESIEPRVYDGTGIPLLRLTDDILFIEDLPLTPQKNCEILYAPQTVVRKYLLGGEKLQADQSYRTTKFNILQPDAVLPPEDSQPVNAEPSKPTPSETAEVPPSEPVEEPAVPEQEPGVIPRITNLLKSLPLVGGLLR